MPAFGDSAADRVRRASDIAEVVGETVALKRRGRKLFGLCPFHGEKTPSFSVDPEQQLFYCFGCHKGGNVFTFVMERDHRTFPEALRYLAERAGIALDGAVPEGAGAGRRDRLYRLLSELQGYYREQLSHHREALAFLQRRGLDVDSVEEWGIGFAPAEWTAAVGFLRRRRYNEREMTEAGVAAVRPQGGVYDRIRGRITPRALTRVSPFAVPVLLEIGRETVASAADALMEESADELIAEAMRLDPAVATA